MKPSEPKCNLCDDLFGASIRHRACNLKTESRTGVPVMACHEVCKEVTGRLSVAKEVQQ